jgi:hypothetical protein
VVELANKDNFIYKTKGNNATLYLFFYRSYLCGVVLDTGKVLLTRLAIDVELKIRCNGQF